MASPWNRDALQHLIPCCVFQCRQGDRKSAMLTGSCLCGKVAYSILGTLGRAFYCHCSRCRKASGSAFASNATIEAGQFELTRGQDALSRYDFGSGLQRVFCGTCGSPIYSWRPADPSVLRIRLEKRRTSECACVHGLSRAMAHHQRRSPPTPGKTSTHRKPLTSQRKASRVRSLAYQRGMPIHRRS